MSTGEILVDRTGAVVTLTLSNPGKRNALSDRMYAALEAQLDAAAQDAALRAVVLQGANGAFAGGTDIRDLAHIETGADGVAYEAHMSRVQASLLALRIPVISVVNGPCVGGGLVLAALSDIVLCTPDAIFGSPVARTLGNTLSATSVSRLQECFGRRATAEMLLTGRLLDAEEALHAGFITAVLPEEELRARLTSTLDSIQKCAPLTLRSFKEMERRLDTHASQVDVTDIFEEIYGSRDFREGVASFLERRKPAFRGE